MTQTLASPDPLLVNIVLVVLVIGLPLLIALCARILWDRNLKLGRSKELEKLIWQLHRIASALEHQMNLSFPAVQPGTEEPHDVTFLQPIVTQPSSGVPSAAARDASASATSQPEEQQPATPASAVDQLSGPVLQGHSAADTHRRAGVNSMFDL